jgi:hypothetical protein
MWEENPKAILITESTLADSFRAYFEFMWKLAKR